MRFIWKFPIAIILISAVFLPSVCISPANGSTGTAAQDIPYFGVTFGGNTTAEAKVLIDKVKGFTNLFVVDNWDIAMNETALTEICQYAYDANLYFMVYFSFIFSNVSSLNSNSLNLYKNAGIEPFHVPWLSSANDRWGDKFLGAYVLDEPGGKQIDFGHYSGFATTYSGRNQTTFANVTSYSDAANRFVRGLKTTTTQRLNNATVRNSIPNATGRVIPVFTADNALYWFDYLAGYNAVFAELGWTNNEVQHIALCRGAANVQNKQWGAIICWASNNPPTMASGPQMLEDLNLAYSAGAQYLLVFNYPQLNPYGNLSNEHFKALQDFWNQMHHSPRSAAAKDSHVALVLPKDYGWGMRQPTDNIWGFWPEDTLAPVIGAKIATLIKQYGTNLDIIFDDPHFNYTEEYSTIYFWNGTTIQNSQSFFSLSSPYLYASITVTAIGLVIVPSYFVVKNKKHRTPSSPTIQVQPKPSSKATLTNFGKGNLEFGENRIVFRTEKGRFGNRKEMIKEIPLAEIEDVKQFGRELSLTWRGAIEVLLIKDPVLAEIISEKANEHLQEQRKIVENQVIIQVENTKTVSTILYIVDMLFDVLRSLEEKKIDWTQMETYLRHFEEKNRSLITQNRESIDLDSSMLLLAVNKHFPKETSKEAYDLLRGIYEQCSVLISKNSFPEENQAIYIDVWKIILACYILNDIILSITIGEKDNQRETSQLMTLLESQSSTSDLKINISELKSAMEKLGTAKEKEEFIKESRKVFRRFLSPNPILKS